jgi:phosphoglycerate dehydrogenase-like enzyme
MTRVAICSRSFSKHSVLRAELTAHYPNATFNDAGLALKDNSLVDYLRGHEKAVVALEPITDAVLAALPELKVISKFGVGYDKLDLSAMANRNIALGWSGGINKRSVSELTICFAINLLRHVSRSDREVRDGHWKLRPGQQLSDRTVGIIGCGHVGKDLAILLRAFGCRVLAHDILDFAEFYQAHGIEACGLETLLQIADIVTLHLPLDASTENFMSAERLAMMRPEALLINAARGGLVDESALKDMLRGDRLAGAAFDVFASEPPEDPELLNLPNFLAVPHIGGSTDEGILAMGRAAIAGLEDNRIPKSGVYPL